MAHKLIDLAVLVVLIGGTLIYQFGSSSETPQASVMGALLTKFPSVHDATWVKGKGESWEARFYHEGVSYTVYFDIDGTWKKTVHEIKRIFLPKKVDSVLRSKYTAFEIGKVEITENPGGVYYDTELKRANNIMVHVHMDSDGNVIR